jgi:hypothetical protein
MNGNILPEMRFSKICWNYNGWHKPSGLDGKSRDAEAYERKYKFGHEEWLFDFDKLINGYHYEALHSIGKFRDMKTQFVHLSYASAT